MRNKIWTFSLLALLAALPALGQLPENIKWETNMDDPPIGDISATKGGTYVDYIPGYPMTFRLYGPNSNEYFANWSRPMSMDLGLVWRHPTTDNFIPVLATHWSVQGDHRTVFYKLDQDAKWSDGQPITADDYVYAKEFLSSPLIRDPAVNQAMEDYIEEVAKIDDYTIKIVGKQDSWRPLEDYNFTPIPKHATKLTETWVEDTNYTPPVVQGPYTIGEFKLGEKLAFVRNPDWWGNDKQYFKGMFNVDRIELRIIADVPRAFDFFKNGELSCYQVMSSRQWATQMEFDAFEKGWVHKKRVYLEEPQGISGIVLNLSKPIFQNIEFRKALQYLFNFEELNEKLMYNAYYRKVSAFEGTEFANPELKPYGFNPKEGIRHLRAAGYYNRGSDGILTDENDQRASFTLQYASKTFERHLTVVKNLYQKAGIEINLQLIEPSAGFEKMREGAFEAAVTAMTGGFYPAPHQYFSSEFKNKPQTNNFWNFGNEDTDKLIDIYRFSMEDDERLSAMHKLDSIIQDEAFYIPFWSAPYTRLLHWDYVEFPEYYFPKRSQSIMEYQVFWINQEKKAKLEAAMAAGTAYPKDTVVEVDPYGVKARIEGSSE